MSLGILLLSACGGEGGDRSSLEAGSAAREGAPRSTRLDLPPPIEDVLLITVDTLRADALGYAGEVEVETPALDRLAAGGAVFTNAHAHNVVTLPSHANILTGLLPYEHGVRENAGFELPESSLTAASHFRRAGFATGAVVGAFPLARRYGLARDFEFYDDRFDQGWGAEDQFPERSGLDVVRIGMDWWRTNADRRRFLWLHLYDPHAPYAPPEPWASRYSESPYLGEVAATDAYLSRILEPFLDGEQRPALIVFTSDHGEALGAHGEATHGFFAYEPTLKVPLVLWAPGIETRSDHRLVRHVDLLPTMLEAAGLNIPDGLSGRSLFTEFEHEATVSYLEALSANLNRGWAPLRGVIKGDYKLVSVPITELYNLAQDEDEQVNIIQTERKIGAELRAELPEEDDWPPTRQHDVSEGVKDLLLSLGYLTGEVEQKETFTEEDDPKNLVNLDRKLHEVIDHLNSGQIEDAERKAREVIAVRPMAVAYSLLGRALRIQHRDEEAIEVLEAAVRTGFAQEATVRQLALSMSNVGRFEEALEVLLPLRTSGDAANLNALASVLIETGQLGAAQQVLTDSLAIEPGNPITYETLALAALRAGRWQETRQAAERALAIDDRLSLAWNYLGGAHYNLGNRREAVDAWEQSVIYDPQNFDAMFNLAVVAREIGDVERARRALRQFIDTAPPNRYGPDIQKAIQWNALLDG